MLGVLTGDPTPYLQDEIRVAGELRHRGALRELWLREDMSGVVALIEANDEAAAQALVNEFPMVQNGLYRIELVALVPPPG